MEQNSENNKRSEQIDAAGDALFGSVFRSVLSWLGIYSVGAIFGIFPSPLNLDAEKIDDPDMLHEALDEGYSVGKKDENGVTVIKYSFDAQDVPLALQLLMNDQFHQPLKSFDSEVQKEAAVKIMQTICDAANVNVRWELAAEGEEPDHIFTTGKTKDNAGFVNTKGSQKLIFVDEEHIKGKGNFAEGSDSYQTLMHEILHAMGLKHSFWQDGETSLGVKVFAEKYDSYNFTVMSYTSSRPDNPHEIRGRFPVTPMFADVKALQEKYGVRPPEQAVKVIDVSDLAKGKHVFAAGEEIIANERVRKGVINLQEGVGKTSFVEIDKSRGGATAYKAGFLLMPGTNIRNVTAVNSVSLVGNELDNVLQSGGFKIKGGGGDDTLTGTRKMDMHFTDITLLSRLTGGEGKDAFVAGAGNVQVEDFSVSQDCIMLTEDVADCAHYTKDGDTMLRFMNKDGEFLNAGMLLKNIEIKSITSLNFVDKNRDKIRVDDKSFIPNELPKGFMHMAQDRSTLHGESFIR